MRKMRESAKVVNTKVTIEVRNAKASGNGRTARKTLSNAEIQKLLNMDYKPGTSEQLAASDAQLGYSLIKSAVEDRWEVPPWTDTLKPMTVRIWFGGGGRVVNYKLERSSGDAKADRSILSAASRVRAIPGLPPAFIEAYKSKGIPCQFTVRPH
jgi:TonB family protein